MKFTDLLFQNENFTREKRQCYGMHRGYYVTSEFVEYDIFGIVQYQSLQEKDYQTLVSLATQMQQAHKRLDVVIKHNYAQVHIRTSRGGKKEAATMESCIDGVINFLQSIGAGTGCANCGSNEPLVINHYEDIPKFVCATCVQNINEQIQKEASKPKVKSSVIPGTIGALLGSLVGVAVWFIIYQFGYIAAISAIVMSVCAMWGYEKLGRSLDVKGIIISSIIVLAMVYVTNRLCWAYELKKAVEDNMLGTISFGDAFRYLEDVVKELDVTADYIRDIVVSYVFSIVGLISMIVSSLKGKRRR